ncbi:MAG: NAD(P)H-hydrate dehydratase [Synergistales bacterium]|nr:NAD(P)H-hydrate dehydratase [Synergistales bacterium]
MRHLYTAEQVREADRRAIEDMQIPGELLMENAGGGAVREILRRFPKTRRAVVLAGPGNNGGDGFVAARHLAINGVEPVVVATAEAGRYRGDAALNRGIAERLGIPLHLSGALADREIGGLLDRTDLVVDALLGTGSKGAPRGEIERLLTFCRNCGAPAAALDVPSGIDATTGERADLFFRADLTATFLGAKAGLYTMPAREAAGEITVVPIGVPGKAVFPQESGYALMEPAELRAFYPGRAKDTHKSREGVVLVVGGSAFYRSAPVLTALGALRAGAGLVVLLVPEAAAGSCAAQLPEAVVQSACPGDVLGPDAMETVRAWTERADVVVLGPGCGREESTVQLCASLWEELDIPMVVDADALYALAVQTVRRFRGDTVLTPHEGEAARLLGSSVAGVADARMDAVRQLAGRYGCCLLKGANTLVADAHRVFVVDRGGPRLAVPGSGDVLGGVIASLMAKGHPPERAAAAGALLHAMAGEAAGESCSEEGLLASEIAHAVPKVLGCPADD